MAALRARHRLTALVRPEVKIVLTIRTGNVGLLCHETIRMGARTSARLESLAANALSLSLFDGTATHFSRPMRAMKEG
jgi:hypothetical protein